MRLAPYVSLSMYSVKRMLKLADVGPGDVVYDLGSGDGRIVISAIVDFHATKAVGIEIRCDLVQIARDEIQRLHVDDRVHIIHGDALKTNISEADVVTLYLTDYGNELLKPKLEEELRSGARVVSLDYRVPEWLPVKVEGLWREIYLYIR